MKILVAGGSGFIGSHLLPKLVEAGHETYNLVRGVNATARAGVISIPCDLRQMESCNLPTVDVVVHLAQSNIRFPEGADDLLTINCVSAVRLALAAIAGGARKFIYCSTGNVYGLNALPRQETDPLLGGGFYAESKIAAEKMLLELKQKISIDILRVFTPYGPKQQLFRLIPDVVSRVQDGRPVSTRDNRMPLLSPLYVDDAVAAIMARVASSDENILNLAGDLVFSVEDIARLAGTILGREPVFETIKDTLSGGISADNTKMRALLGRACIPLAQGLGNYIAWRQNHE